MINKELLKGSTVTLILTLLGRRPMYGYEMISTIQADSGGVLSFREGTLYPILHTLESEGMVNSYWSEDGGTRKRKYYQITEAGTRHLATRREEWSTFRSAVDRVIGGAEA